MSTYVMSDIHGNLDRFEKVLKQIDLQDDDKVYILGDVIDRNPYGIEILLRIMEDERFEMLLGNHEYMMLDYLDKYYILLNLLLLQYILIKVFCHYSLFSSLLYL